MKYCYSIREIKAADEAAIRAGTSSLTLMERAGNALAEKLLLIMKERAFSDVLIVAGGGNNGGDGFAAARILYEAGKDVAVLCLAKKFSPDCAAMAKRFQGELFGRIPRRRFALIADCLLGTGLVSAPEGDVKTLIEFINLSGAYVLACDLPSGLAENGIALEPCVRADETLTIGGLKSALLLSDGADFSGEISVAQIGLTLPSGKEIWEQNDVRALFPKRKSNVHKGNFGSALIFAGGAVLSGAAFLAANACLKSGAGYTKLSVAEPYFLQAIGKCPAVILRRFEAVDGEMLAADCVAMGMGAGVSERLYAHIVELLNVYTGTLVLDADALNSLAMYGTEILKEKSCRVILTPHPKEFARLIGVNTEEALAHAVEYAQNFAKTHGAVVVLKGNRTVITDGMRTAINTTGSPALAKGGSGDVLAGFLTGTCARGVPPFEAACASCYLLGRAGELAAEELGEYSPDATDIIRSLPKAIKEL